MKSIRFFLFVFLFLSFTSSSSLGQFTPQLEWLYATTGMFIPKNVITGPQGDVYITGALVGEADLNGPSVPGGVVTAAWHDIIVAKFNAEGTLLWTRVIDGSFLPKLGLGPNEEVYISGESQGWQDFDGPSITGQGGEIYLGTEQTVFIARYTPDNEFDWAIVLDAKHVGFHEFDVSAAGNLYLRGQFWGSADLDGSLQTGHGGELVAEGLNYFVAKYSPSGQFLWANLIGPDTIESIMESRGLSAGPNDDVYVVFRAKGYIDLDGPDITGLGGEWHMQSDELLLAKYAPDGDLRWVAHTYSPEGIFWLYGVDVSPDDHAFVTGGWSGTADFDGPLFNGQGGEAVSQSVDAFIVKYTPQGSFERVIIAAGPESEYPYHLSVNETNIFVTGYFIKGIDFDGPNAHATGSELLGTGNQDLFLASYTHDGSFLWAKGATGATGNDYGRWVHANSNGQIAFVGGMPNVPVVFEGEELTEPFFFLSFFETDGITEYQPGPPYYITPVSFNEYESHIFIHPEDIVTSLIDSEGHEMPVESAVFTAVTADEELENELLADGCQFLGLPATLNEESNGRVYTIHMAATDGYGVTGEWQVPVHILREGMEEAEQDETEFEAVVCSEGGESQKAYSRRPMVASQTQQVETRLSTYPNPFNPQTTLSLTLQRSQYVELAVFDILGRQIALIHSGTLSSGVSHDFIFDASALPSGSYLVRIQGEDFVQSKRISLIK